MSQRPERKTPSLSSSLRPPVAEATHCTDAFLLSIIPKAKLQKTEMNLQMQLLFIIAGWSLFFSLSFFTRKSTTWGRG